MDPKKEAQAILQTRKPPRRRRAAHGQWIQPAQVVAILCSEGWNVSDAVREVIDREGYVKAAEGTDEYDAQFRQAFDGIRAAHYLAERKKNRQPPNPDDFQL